MSVLVVVGWGALSSILVDGKASAIQFLGFVPGRQRDASMVAPWRLRRLQHDGRL